ncbi:MAG TPA: hypothetical protein VGF18_09460 [Candidatus Tumulicola sp.]|jgi:hypothetical protein
MKRTVGFIIGAAALALAFAPGPTLALQAHITHPIRVTTCNPQRNTYMSGGYVPAYYPGGPYWGWPSVYGYNYYQYPVQKDPTLSIDYSNSTNVVMTDIEFGLVANGRLVAEVRDVGTFSPGAEIKHQFGLNPNVFPLQTSFAKCVPLHIKFADGTKWKNPNLPALQRSIYAHP